MCVIYVSIETLEKCLCETLKRTWRRIMFLLLHEYIFICIYTYVFIYMHIYTYICICQEALALLRLARSRGVCICSSPPRDIC